MPRDRLRFLAARALARAAAWAPTRRFEAALEDPRLTQDALLGRLVAGMARTRYASRYGLEAADGYAAFSRKLPIVDYAALGPWIQEQMRTEERVLCPASVRFYEKSSGSTGPAKHIPYTGALLGSFSRLFAVWLGDLLARGPKLETGRAWLSVSPFASAGGRTARGVRVGLDSDADYVSGWLGRLLEPFWVLPPGVRALGSPEAFRDVVAAQLLAEEDLEVVSVWNPSMIEAFLGHMLARREPLLRSLRERSIEREGRRFPLRASPRRARALESLLRDLEPERVDWSEVWPRLKLVSCWDQGHAGPAAAAVKRLWPHAWFQGKGLLATEAPVTVPLLEAGGCLPMLGEVFLEFEEPAGSLRRLHELSPGAEYRLIISQAGGLCRYRLGDRVRAGVRWKATPTLELLGRADEVSDLVGEKLHSEFVEGALDRLNSGARFRLLLPRPGVPGRAAAYVLVLDRSGPPPETLARLLDESLSESVHYRAARAMGQLGPVEARVRADARRVIDDHRVSQGRVWGGLKPAPLVLDGGEGERLADALR